jgi:hypothetical protein
MVSSNNGANVELGQHNAQRSGYAFVTTTHPLAFHVAE